MVRTRTLTWLGLALIGAACDSASSPEPEPQSQPKNKPTAIASPSELAEPDLEVAFLDGSADPSRISEDARAEAKQCDAGEARQCRSLANRYEEGLGAPNAPDRALALYERGCAEGLGYHCLLGGWLLTATRDTEQRNAGLELLRRACELDHLHACVAAAAVLGVDPAANDEVASLRAKACRGGYAIACDPGQKSEPDRAPSSAEAACPGRFHWSASQSGGPRLHGTLDQLDHAAMLATIPEAVPEFTTKSRTSTPAGQAGTRTSVATAEFVRGESRASLSIVDAAPDCTLQPGTGAAMISHAVAERGGRVIDRSGSPGLVFGSSVTIWVADRCVVSGSGSGLDEAELLALAQRVDWTALAKLCAQRP